MTKREKDIKNRKILKVKQTNETINEKKAEPIETPAEKTIEEDKNMEETPEQHYENPYEVRLEELLDDLKLDDDDNDPNIIKENENVVEDFIKQMDSVKISKE